MPPAHPADAFSESDSPKKWAQPLSKRKHIAVTSDGLRTLLLVGGEPVPLSAATSPAHSPYSLSPAQSPLSTSRIPVARSPLARSPLARSPLARATSSPAVQRSLLQGSGGSGAGAFTTVLLPPEGLPHVNVHPQQARPQAVPGHAQPWPRPPQQQP